MSAARDPDGTHAPGCPAGRRLHRRVVLGLLGLGLAACAPATPDAAGSAGSAGLAAPPALPAPPAIPGAVRGARRAGRRDRRRPRLDPGDHVERVLLGLDAHHEMFGTSRALGRA